MKNTFKVTGMSCGGCTSTVEKTLNEITGITKAIVSLPNRAVIEMDTDVPIETLQEALKKVGHYTIMEAAFLDKSVDKERGSCCGGGSSSKKEDKTSCC